MRLLKTVKCIFQMETVANSLNNVIALNNITKIPDKKMYFTSLIEDLLAEHMLIAPSVYLT